MRIHDQTQPPPPAVAPPAAPVTSAVPWREVITYTVLAYAIAWTLFFASVPDLPSMFTADRTPDELDAPAAIAILGMFSPALAAAVMRRFVSREGFRGSLGRRATWRHYGWASLGPMVFVTIVIVLAVATGRADFVRPDTALPLAYVAFLLQGVTVIALFALGEEYGWRGYLLPRLLPLGEVRAAVIVGLIWGPWHAPMLVAGLNFADVHPWAAVAVFVPAGIAISLLVTRLYVAAGASVLVAAVAHGSLNAFSDGLTDADHLTGNPLVVGPGGAVGIGVMTAAALLAYRVRRSAAAREEEQGHSRPRSHMR